jgi:hypothetical protein
MNYSFSRGRFLFITVGYRRALVLRWDMSYRCPCFEYWILSARNILRPSQPDLSYSSLFEVLFVSWIYPESL